MDMVKCDKIFNLFLWITMYIFHKGVCTPSFVKSINIQDKFCSLMATINFATSSSVIDCAIQCYNNADCRSFFYKQIGVCVGSASSLNDPMGCSTENGMKYYTSTGKIREVKQK